MLKAGGATKDGCGRGFQGVERIAKARNTYICTRLGYLISFYT